MICLTLQLAPLVKSSTLVHSQQKQGKRMISYYSNCDNSLGTIMYGCGLVLSNWIMQWQRPKLVAMPRSREVLVNPRQNSFCPFPISLSGLLIPRQRSRYLPCLALALSLRANFSLLYCSNCFLTTPITADILSYSLLRNSWFIFLQVQLPVQRQTKHLRAAYCYSGWKRFSACPFSRSSAISSSINPRMLVVATLFFSMASLMHCVYFSWSFLSVVAQRSISATLFMAFLFLRKGNKTSSILAWKQWMCASLVMFAMMSPSRVIGSQALPCGSAKRLNTCGWFVHPITVILFYQSRRTNIIPHHTPHTHPIHPLTI